MEIILIHAKTNYMDEERDLDNCKIELCPFPKSWLDQELHGALAPHILCKDCFME